MADFKERVDALAQLMEEFSLSEASLEGDDWRISFKKAGSAPAPTGALAAPVFVETPAVEPDEVEEPEAEDPAGPGGEPITSPMNGIFYSASSPTAPPFVKVGEEVSEGQVVGLIEAMKVFNEIVAPHPGTVTAISVDNGQLVQPGDVLLLIEAL